MKEIEAAVSLEPVQNLDQQAIPDIYKAKKTPEPFLSVCGQSGKETNQPSNIRVMTLPAMYIRFSTCPLIKPYLLAHVPSPGPKVGFIKTPKSLVPLTSVNLMSRVK